MNKVLPIALVIANNTDSRRSLTKCPYCCIQIPENLIITCSRNNCPSCGATIVIDEEDNVRGAFDHSHCKICGELLTTYLDNGGCDEIKVCLKCHPEERRLTLADLDDRWSE